MPRNYCTSLWHARKQVGARAVAKGITTENKTAPASLEHCCFRHESKCRGKHRIMLDVCAGAVRVCEKHAPLVETPKRAKSGG